MTSGLDYLGRVAGRDVPSLYEARTRAYAIYILTRNGEVTTNALTNLHERLERQYADEWRVGLVQNAAHGAGVMQAHALIDVAQIGMGVELQYDQIPVALGERPDRAPTG